MTDDAGDIIDSDEIDDTGIAPYIQGASPAKARGRLNRLTFVSALLVATTLHASAFYFVWPRWRGYVSPRVEVQGNSAGGLNIAHPAEQPTELIAPPEMPAATPQTNPRAGDQAEDAFDQPSANAGALQQLAGDFSEPGNFSLLQSPQASAAQIGPQSNRAAHSQSSSSSMAGMVNAAPFSNNKPPTYPADALADRLEGTVVLRVNIDAGGGVTDIRVARSSGHRSLDEAAFQAVRTWHFQPATMNGIATSCTEDQPIPFVIKR